MFCSSTSSGNRARQQDRVVELAQVKPIAHLTPCPFLIVSASATRSEQGREQERERE
jgi:hypothetical protein